MTNQETVSREIDQLRGATITVWTYSVSHQTLTLRLQQSDQRANTHLVCDGCSRIEVSPHWLNANLEISSVSPDKFLIVDASARVRIECLAVSVQHDVAPVF
jgi:hypothetical protein